jgi:CRP-like cAMP-binding protein
LAGKLYKKVERCFNAGEVIFQQGDPSDGIYSVKLGRVSVYKSKPTPTGMQDIEIVRLGPGSMFGEMGMLDQTRRDASVRAVEYTECVVITQDMFENQMTTLPPWVVNFIKILISRLRTTNEKLIATLKVLEAHGLAVEEKVESADAPAAAAPPPDAPASKVPPSAAPVMPKPMPPPAAPQAAPKPATAPSAPQAAGKPVAPQAPKT